MSNVHSLPPVGMYAEPPADLPADLDPETGEALGTRGAPVDVLGRDGVMLHSQNGTEDWLPTSPVNEDEIVLTVLEAGKTAFEAKCRIGRALAWARRDLGSGGLDQLLESRIGWLSRRTAYRLMKVAEAAYKNDLIRKLGNAGGICKALLATQMTEDELIEITGAEELGDEEVLRLAKRPLVDIKRELQELREDRDRAESERRDAVARAEKAEQKLGATVADPDELEAEVLAEVARIRGVRDEALRETAAFCRRCTTRWDELSPEARVEVGRLLYAFEMHARYHAEHFRQLSEGEGLDQHIFDHWEERMEALGEPMPEAHRPVLVAFDD